ncbi:MAG: DegV family EDD domain-containing protein [Oscillospiraceae bacterium]|nr:DegV family EDD domain-containing protein [Oscillospiraceae bacterium]
MIAIVVDSTVYMTRREAHLYGVSIVPSIYNNKYDKYIDDIKDDSIYDEIFPTTKQPDVKSFYNTFRELGKRGYDILCLTISSKMSGTYNSACVAANHIKSVNICVVDSRVTGGGMFMLVKKARMMADRNIALNDIANEIIRMRDNIVLRYTVDELNIMKNSKRVSYIRQSAVSMLNLKPVFSCDKGAILMEDPARNGYDLIRRLTAGIPSETDYIIIHYIIHNQLVEDVRKYLTAKYTRALIQLRKLGPVIGINTGSSICAVVWYEE